MAHALVYVLSRDKSVHSCIKQVSDFIFVQYETLEELAAAMNKRAPDLLLVDYDLPDAESLRHDPILGLATEQAHIPHDRVRGFLLKSASPGEFADWLLRNEQLLDERVSVEHQLSESFKTAMAAMASMGEVGVAMRFLTDAFNIRDYASLCERILDAVEEYELGGACQIRIPGETYLTTRDTSQRDADTFAQMRDLGRILEFKARVIVNYAHVSILVRNMPDDEIKRGRMRDNLAILAEGADARVKSLLLETDNANKQRGIQKALADIREMVIDIRDRSKSSPLTIKRLINDAINQVQVSFLHLALRPSQENALLEPLLLLRDSYEAEQSSFTVDTRLSAILTTLESISQN